VGPPLISSSVGLLQQETTRMAFAIAPLSEATERDFWAIHDGDACNGCYCMAWHAETWECWTNSTPINNRKDRSELLAKGQYDGFILYEDSAPIGWCQIARVGSMPKLLRAVNLPELADSYAISCFLLRPDKRGRGIGSKFLSMVAAHWQSASNAALVGVPEKAATSNTELWTGTDGMFFRAGFSPHPGNERVFVLSRA